ncbi:hypothetical protein Tco_1553982 [Tanacetum coccineum]
MEGGGTLDKGIGRGGGGRDGRKGGMEGRGKPRTRERKEAITAGKIGGSGRKEVSSVMVLRDGLFTGMGHGAWDGWISGSDLNGLCRAGCIGSCDINKERNNMGIMKCVERVDSYIVVVVRKECFSEEVCCCVRGERFLGEWGWFTEMRRSDGKRKEIEGKQNPPCPQRRGQKRRGANGENRSEDNP